MDDHTIGSDMVDMSMFGGASTPGQSLMPAPKDLAQSEKPKPFPEQGTPLKEEGEYYVYKGMDGIPFRSTANSAPDLKALDAKQPVIVCDAVVRIFDTANVEEFKAYQKVWDDIAKGRAKPSTEEKRWLPESRSWKIFLRWAQLYWEIPK
jgi:hypothetical protein